MKCVFFSTPAYTRPVLKALLDDTPDYVNLDLVVTAPDRSKGRGQQKKAPPMKKIAMSRNCTVYQPEDVNGEESIHRLAQVEPDVFLVSSFGQIFARDLLEVAEIGAYNVHPSLLPRYRGPAPIAHALLDGCEETGVSIFSMDENVDQGPVIKQERVSIDPQETRGELRERLFQTARTMIPEVLQEISKGEISFRDQDDEEASYARLLSKEDGNIDWSESRERIHNRVRAMKPWPGAYSYLDLSSRNDSMRVLVHQTQQPAPGEIPESNQQALPGTVIGTKHQFLVQTGTEPIRISCLQPQNKPEMDADDFLNGYQPSVGDRFIREPS